MEAIKKAAQVATNSFSSKPTSEELVLAALVDNKKAGINNKPQRDAIREQLELINEHDPRLMPNDPQLETMISDAKGKYGNEGTNPKAFVGQQNKDVFDGLFSKVAYNVCIFTALSPEQQKTEQLKFSVTIKNSSKESFFFVEQEQKTGATILASEDHILIMTLVPGKIKTASPKQPVPANLPQHTHPLQQTTPVQHSVYQGRQQFVDHTQHQPVQPQQTLPQTLLIDQHQPQQQFVYPQHQPQLQPLYPAQRSSQSTYSPPPTLPTVPSSNPSFSGVASSAPQIPTDWSTPAALTVQHPLNAPINPPFQPSQSTQQTAPQPQPASVSKTVSQAVTSVALPEIPTQEESKTRLQADMKAEGKGEYDEDINFGTNLIRFIQRGGTVTQPVAIHKENIKFPEGEKNLNVGLPLNVYIVNSTLGEGTIGFFNGQLQLSSPAAFACLSGPKAEATIAPWLYPNQREEMQENIIKLY